MQRKKKKKKKKRRRTKKKRRRKGWKKMKVKMEGRVTGRAEQPVCS